MAFAFNKFHPDEGVDDGIITTVGDARFLKLTQPSGSEQATSGKFKLAALETDLITDASTAVLAISLNSRSLYDALAYLSIDWANRQLFDSVPNLSLDYENRYLSDGAYNSMDWLGRALYDSSGNEVFNFYNDPHVYGDFRVDGVVAAKNEPTFTYNVDGTLQQIDYPNGFFKAFTYNVDGTLNEINVNNEYTKTLVWSSGVLQSIGVT